MSEYNLIEKEEYEITLVESSVRFCILTHIPSQDILHQTPMLTEEEMFDVAINILGSLYYFDSHQDGKLYIEKIIAKLRKFM